MKDADVVHYLTQHPDFFLRHPRLIEQLRIPGEAQGVRSMAHFQIDAANKRVVALQGKLQRWVENATASEQLWQHLLGLARIWLTIRPDDAAVCEAISERFEIDVVKLVDPYRWDARARDQLSEEIHSDDPMVGRFTPAKLALLFGDDSDRVRSAAVAPLAGHSRLLLLGASDDERFSPARGVDVVRALASLVEAAR